MVAMLRPDLFGPCLVAGSPMSYWQGVHGKNPMRYSGGLLGGSWLTALTSDLGDGSFDGTWLIAELRQPQPGQLAVGQAVRRLRPHRHRRPRATWSSRSGGATSSSPQRRRNPVSGRRPVRRRQADPQPAAVERRHACSTCATSPRRSSASPRWATTSVRPSRRWAGFSISIATSTTSAPPAGPSSTAWTRRSGIWRSSSRQGRRQAGRGVRPAHGRDRLPAARPLRDGHDAAPGRPGRGAELRHRRLDLPFRDPLARRHPRAGPQQRGRRPRLRRRGPAVARSTTRIYRTFIQPFVRAHGQPGDGRAGPAHEPAAPELLRCSRAAIPS